MLTVEDGVVAAMFSDGGESAALRRPEAQHLRTARGRTWCMESSMSDGASQNTEKKGRR
jgi:hypothetical protein